eukprot:m.144504 g.144504  ORF g.144504 m.144504 type:complete len:849 (+) comp14132_c0_seq3:271-2817(+)
MADDGKEKEELPPTVGDFSGSLDDISAEATEAASVLLSLQALPSLDHGAPAPKSPKSPPKRTRTPKRRSATASTLSPKRHTGPASRRNLALLLESPTATATATPATSAASPNSTKPKATPKAAAVSLNGEGSRIIHASSAASHAQPQQSPRRVGASGVASPLLKHSKQHSKIKKGSSPLHAAHAGSTASTSSSAFQGAARSTDNSGGSGGGRSGTPQSIAPSEMKPTRSALSETMVTMGEALAHVVQGQKSRDWIFYEFFYSSLDEAILKKTASFEHELAQAFPNVSQTRRMRQTEWRYAKQLMGRPRRFSTKFVGHQRATLRSTRNAMRTLVETSTVPPEAHSLAFPKQIPLMYCVGDRVLARHRTRAAQSPSSTALGSPVDPKHKRTQRIAQQSMVAPGMILALESDAVYRVAFDSHDYVNETVEDIYIKPLTTHPTLTMEQLTQRLGTPQHRTVTANESSQVHRSDQARKPLPLFLDSSISLVERVNALCTPKPSTALSRPASLARTPSDPAMVFQTFIATCHAQVNKVETLVADMQKHSELQSSAAQDGNGASRQQPYSVGLAPSAQPLQYGPGTVVSQQREGATTTAQAAHSLSGLSSSVAGSSANGGARYPFTQSPLRQARSATAYVSRVAHVETQNQHWPPPFLLLMASYKRCVMFQHEIVAYLDAKAKTVPLVMPLDIPPTLRWMLDVRSMLDTLTSTMYKTLQRYLIARETSTMAIEPLVAVKLSPRRGGQHAKRIQPSIPLQFNPSGLAQHAAHQAKSLLLTLTESQTGLKPLSDKIHGLASSMLGAIIAIRDAIENDMPAAELQMLVEQLKQNLPESRRIEENFALLTDMIYPSADG